MHKSQDVLTREIREATKLVEIGADYYHYKDQNKTYKVLNIAVTEDDDQLCVIYQAQYGKNIIFVRPLKSWISKVVWQGNGKQKRFTKVTRNSRNGRPV